MPPSNTNRFLELATSLRELDRQRARGAQAPTPHASPLSVGRSRYARSFTASERTLVVLLENGGINLNVRMLIDKLPGTSLIPESQLVALSNAVDAAFRKLTDNFLEGAELALNRYSSAKPDKYGSVVVLRNGTALYANLRDTLLKASEGQGVIDLMVLTQGGPDSIATANGTTITGKDISDLKAANGGKPLRLRSVYMMNCVGSSLNQAWLDAGARVSAGALANNYLPEPTTFFFFTQWKAGVSFSEAVTGAYRKTVALLSAVFEGALTTAGLPSAVVRLVMEQLVDLQNRDFIRDSAPVLAGDGSLLLTSDTLPEPARTKSLSFAYVPLSHTTSGPSHPKAASASAVEFVKSFESFSPDLYDDPVGHCTVGYGELVHRGPCDGAESEAPYLNGITEQEGTRLVARALAKVERTIKNAVTVDLSQSQFDALVCFTYNVGDAALRSSTLLKKLNAGEYAAVPTEMLRWDKAQGKVLPGLIRRRKAEAAMFKSASYSTMESFRSRAFDNDEDLGNSRDLSLEEARVRAFLRMLRVGEGTVGSGGYERLFGGSSFIKDHGRTFADHPRILISKGKYQSTAAGAYQVLKGTWDEPAQVKLRARYGINDFEPKSQDRFGVVLVKHKRSALEEVKQGHIRAAIEKCNREWASLPGAPYGQPMVNWDKAIADYNSYLDQEKQGESDLAIGKGEIDDLLS